MQRFIAIKCRTARTQTQLAEYEENFAIYANEKGMQRTDRTKISNDFGIKNRRGRYKNERRINKIISSERNEGK